MSPVARLEPDERAEVEGLVRRLADDRSGAIFGELGRVAKFAADLLDDLEAVNETLLPAPAPGTPAAESESLAGHAPRPWCSHEWVCLTCGGRERGHARPAVHS